MKATVYDTATGEIVSRRTVPNASHMAPYVPEGRAYIAGHYDPDEYRIVNGEPVAKPPAVVDTTAQAWTALRTKRDRLLAKSDYTQLADSPQDAAAWATYRQALRDLPAATQDPLNVVWPTRPT